MNGRLLKLCLLLCLLPALGHGLAAVAPRARVEAVSSEGITLAWNVTPGKRYLVEVSEDLGGGWWVDPYGPGVLVATEDLLHADLAFTGSARFFRVRQLPDPPANPEPDYLVWIPPGTFMMGTPEDELGRENVDGPLTRVTLTQGYWLGKYEVTIDEYRQFLLAGGDPSGVDWADPQCPINQDETFSLRGNPWGRRGDLPMVEIVWAGAMAYCDWRTEMARAAGTLPAGYVYSLPTEAQWEYAARAGTQTRFSFGDAPECTPGHCAPCPSIDDYMWWCGNSQGRTQPVGQKLPNPWGLYDMHGNVWEWTWNFWEWNLPGGAQVDPLGPPSSRFRTRRGGGWEKFAENCRSGMRFGGTPTGSIFSLGLRVALVPERK